MPEFNSQTAVDSDLLHKFDTEAQLDIPDLINVIRIRILDYKSEIDPPNSCCLNKALVLKNTIAKAMNSIFGLISPSAVGYDLWNYFILLEDVAKFDKNLQFIDKSIVYRMYSVSVELSKMPHVFMELMEVSNLLRSNVVRLKQTLKLISNTAFFGDLFVTKEFIITKDEMRFRC